MYELGLGKVWKFGSNISTDLIVPGRLSYLRSNLPELAKHILEDADLDFSKKMRPGDYIVADENFGTGSSREHAVEVIRLSKISAVIAKSFARIFYRNGSNVGIWLIEADTELLMTGDIIEVDIEKSQINIINKNLSIPCRVPDNILLKILLDGGLIPHIKKHNGYSL